MIKSVYVFPHTQSSSVISVRSPSQICIYLIHPCVIFCKYRHSLRISFHFRNTHIYNSQFAPRFQYQNSLTSTLNMLFCNSAEKHALVFQRNQNTKTIIKRTIKSSFTLDVSEVEEITSILIKAYFNVIYIIHISHIKC